MRPASFVLHTGPVDNDWVNALARMHAIAAAKGATSVGEPTRINLTPAMFGEQEMLLVEDGPLAATTFRFPTGVCGLRLGNQWGDAVMLPWQGQQIWSLSFGGPGYPRRDLTMRSMFDAPRPTRDFLATFGGFLQHCGIIGLGAPSPQDTHPLHGELPNAPFDSAHLVLGEDERGPFIGLGGSYRHTVAFAHDYTAEPETRLYAGETLVNVAITVTNRKRSPMDLMYLAHVNFRPRDNGQLYYSAPKSLDHVRAHTQVAGHITPGPGYLEFLAELSRDPFRHELLAPDLVFDPEVVFFIDYVADAEGWAHTMQLHPDGSADYIRHRPEQLPRVTRWISRTPDQDAIALAEVGTCEPGGGYLAEKARGNVRVLGPGEQFHCSFDAGLLSAADAQQLKAHINSLVS